MTSELRLQQNRLVAASHLIDERRIFTEAVLSGVPVAVIGVDPGGKITTLNPSAEHLIVPDGEGTLSVLGKAAEDVIPEIASALADARGSQHKLVQGQIQLSRNGRDRLFNVRVTSEPSPKADKSLVVTLDDITDVLDAQRSAAWAGRRPADRARDQEPADTDPALRRADQAQIRQVDHHRPRGVRPVHRDDRPAGR